MYSSFSSWPFAAVWLQCLRLQYIPAALRNGFGCKSGNVHGGTPLSHRYSELSSSNLLIWVWRPFNTLASQASALSCRTSRLGDHNTVCISIKQHCLHALLTTVQTAIASTSRYPQIRVTKSHGRSVNNFCSPLHLQGSKQICWKINFFEAWGCSRKWTDIYSTWPCRWHQPGRCNESTLKLMLELTC